MLYNTKSRKPSGYWTKELCHKEALKHNRRFLFQKAYPDAYYICIKNNWLDEICSHMKLRYPWVSKERCHQESLKFKTKSEFKNGSPGAFGSAFKNKWLNEICSHMINPQKDYKEKGYWTKERCHQEALKYDYINLFKKECITVFNKAIKKGWIEDICSHMIDNVVKTKFTVNNQYKLISEGKKYCPKCKEIKTLENFSKNNLKKIGYESKCKPCYKEYAFEKRKHSDKGLVWKQSLYSKDNKFCPKCNEVKSLSEFPNKKNSIVGKASFCKPCKSISDKEYRTQLKGKGLYSERKRIEYLKNVDAHRAREKNRVRDYADEYRRDQQDPIRSFKTKLRKVLHRVLKGNKKILGLSSEEIFKCSFDELMKHLPFKDKSYQVHHIVPIGHGNTIDELVRLSHYKNFKQIQGKLNGSIGKRIILEWIDDDLKSLFPDILERCEKFIVSIYHHYEEIKITNNAELIKQCEEEIERLEN